MNADRDLQVAVPLLTLVTLVVDRRLGRILGAI